MGLFDWLSKPLQWIGRPKGSAWEESLIKEMEKDAFKTRPDTSKPDPIELLRERVRRHDRSVSGDPTE